METVSSKSVAIVSVIIVASYHNVTFLINAKGKKYTRSNLVAISDVVCCYHSMRCGCNYSWNSLETTSCSFAIFFQTAFSKVKNNPFSSTLI